MKKHLSLVAMMAVAALPVRAQMLVEAEAFQFKGKWVEEKSSECLGTAMLRVFVDADGTADDSGDALTVVSVPEAGRYHVWTRSRDYLSSARPRSYTLTVDGTEMAASGVHGREGFHWEKVGEVDLERKQVLLRLHDSGGYYGRCDAILLTKDASTDPNTLSNTQIARWRRKPVEMDYTTSEAPALPEALDISSGYSTAASISNPDVRLSFVKLASGQIVCKTDYHDGTSWRRFGGSDEDNRIALISNDAANPLNYNNFYPAWQRSSARREFNFDGHTYTVAADGDLCNPFFNGVLTEARATAVSKPDASTIKVTYSCGDRGTITAWWSVPESGAAVNVRMLFKAARDGWYSMVLHGAKGVDTTSGVLMPPMFSGARTGSTPLMMPSAMMTQCVAMVSSDEPTGSATAYLAADLGSFGSDWGSQDYSPCGFSLINSSGDYQPVAFAPCMGMKDSRVRAGATVEARFVAGIVRGGCGNALEFVSDEVFGVTDYRRQDSSSLTDAYGRVKTLVADDDASGWSARWRGFWDIECDGAIAPTVVHSAPLSLLGAAMMADDADFYRRRALPAIEYVLSGRGFRCDGSVPVPLSPLTSQFPTTLYEGINTLTGDLNPWLADIAVPGGELRTANGYFASVEPFRQALSAWRLTGDESWLDKARTLADASLASKNTDTEPLAAGTFYNSRMYADPWALLDLYEATGEQHYADAADARATDVLAGVRTWPRPGQGSITVHPGGVYDGVTTVWWKGAEAFRLGFPRREGDAPEHEVEAWKVSPVGLTIEQPTTNFLRTAGKTVRPVIMTNFAPALLRLAATTGRPVYETYARNAVIGRADNYPGYYATGYTDIPAAADFPYAGPDVSSIYYHHIPSYMAMLQDFLVTEATVRSDGAISFPAARQEGFVWMANNVYGRARGAVYGREARLWMPDGAATADAPDINILMARGSEHIYLIMMNEAAEAMPVRATLGRDVAAVLTSDIATLISADGRETSESLSGASLDVEIPARGLVVAELDARAYGAPVPSLTEGFRTIETGTVAGTVYLYRIRSPFGWDTVYGVAGCGAVEGLTIDIRCEGDAATASAWPYEWSFGEYAYDQSVAVEVTVSLNGRKLGTFSETMEPERSGVEDVKAKEVKTRGIYSIDGRRLDRITSPGLYIIDGVKVYY